MEHNAVIVAGMHRSGTSMVARIASLLGVHFGPERDLMTATIDNPEGYFENWGFVKLHNAVLDMLGASWKSPPIVRWQEVKNSAPALALQQDARVLVHYLSEPGGAWGWKDPRVSLLLDFWQPLIPGKSKLVVCLRNPKEVVASMRKRGDEIDHPYLIWRAYYQAILENADAFDVLWLHYDLFFEHAEKMVERLAAFLSLTPTVEQKQLAAQTINPSLKRRRSGLEDLLGDDEAPELVKNLYVQLLEKCWQASESSDPTKSAHSLSETDVLKAQVAQLQQKCEDLQARAARAAEKANLYCQLFWSEDGNFGESQSARIPYSATSFLSEFDFQIATPGARFLRLDVANRPGQFEIDSLQIESAQSADPAGKPSKVKFAATADATTNTHVWAEWQPKSDAETLIADSRLIVLAFADDPQLRLTIPPEITGPLRIRLRIRHDAAQNDHLRNSIKELKKNAGTRSSAPKPR